MRFQVWRDLSVPTVRANLPLGCTETLFTADLQNTKTKPTKHKDKTYKTQRQNLQNTKTKQWNKHMVFMEKSHFENTLKIVHSYYFRRIQIEFFLAYYEHSKNIIKETLVQTIYKRKECCMTVDETHVY